MKTLALRNQSKPHRPQCRLPKWPQAAASPLRRLCTFLFRDLLPSLGMVIVLAFFAALVGQKIDQARSSRPERIVEVSAHP